MCGSDQQQLVLRPDDGKRDPLLGPNGERSAGEAPDGDTRRVRGHVRGTVEGQQHSILLPEYRAAEGTEADRHKPEHDPDERGG